MRLELLAPSAAAHASGAGLIVASASLTIGDAEGATIGTPHGLGVTEAFGLLERVASLRPADLPYLNREASLEHAVRARKAALSALADAGKKNAHAPDDTRLGEASESKTQSADAAELLVLSLHAAGAQHESLDEPAFCLAAYDKAYAACKKHGIAQDSALLASVRRDLESAQRRIQRQVRACGQLYPVARRWAPN